MAPTYVTSRGTPIIPLPPPFIELSTAPSHVVSRPPTTIHSRTLSDKPSLSPSKLTSTQPSHQPSLIQEINRNNTIVDGSIPEGYESRIEPSFGWIMVVAGSVILSAFAGILKFRLRKEKKLSDDEELLVEGELSDSYDFRSSIDRLNSAKSFNGSNSTEGQSSETDSKEALSPDEHLTLCSVKTTEFN